MKLAEHQQRLLSDAIDTGYGQWAGVEVIEIAAGIARIGFTPRVEMLTPWGAMNGGVISSLVEIPSFLALISALHEGEAPVTNDMFIQHLRPLPGDVRYEIIGSVIRKGKTMAWTDAVVRANEETVSVARITKTILRRSR